MLQDESGGPKVKAVLNHLRGGSRTALRKGAAAAADAVPPARLWQPRPLEDAEQPRATMGVEAAAVRPHMAMCVLHLPAAFGEDSLRAFIAAQTAIHDGTGRRRDACAIGTHDMATLPAGGFGVDAQPPEEVMLVPIKALDEEAPEPRSAAEVVAAALSDTSRDGAATGARKYASVLAELPRVPVLLDSAGAVLSLPPLTNAAHSRVTAGCSRVLVECSSTESLAVCRAASLELIAATIAIFEGGGRECGGGDAGVRVQPVAVANGWGQGHVRATFPSWAELRSFDTTAVE